MAGGTRNAVHGVVTHRCEIAGEPAPSGDVADAEGVNRKVAIP